MLFRSRRLRLAAWCLLDKLAYLGDERHLVFVRAVARRERDVQQALRGAVGAGGRRSGHVRGVHHNGVAFFGVVVVDARARELAVEAALHAESLAIIGLLRAVAAADSAGGAEAGVAVMLATHNRPSVARATQLMRELGLSAAHERVHLALAQLDADRREAYSFEPVDEAIAVGDDHAAPGEEPLGIVEDPGHAPAMEADPEADAPDEDGLRAS